MKYIETDKYVENNIIENFNLSKSKIKNDIKKLIHLSQYAIKNNDNLIGLGDWLLDNIPNLKGVKLWVNYILHMAQIYI